MEFTTNNPVKAYQLWADEDIKVLHGYGWKSAHWSKEYYVFLELTAPLPWIKNFISDNHLRIDSMKGETIDKEPEWFRLKSGFSVWTLPDPKQNSRYYIDTLSGHMFLYEVQL